MERAFNLIKNPDSNLEKRVLPRYPFGHLWFKDETSPSTTLHKVFEVQDISHTGMQIALKEGATNYVSGHLMKGTIIWRTEKIAINAVVEWHLGLRLGVSFVLTPEFSAAMEQFLSVKNIAANMRAMHQEDLGLDLPARLKYWLYSDGPFEVFIWRHEDGEFSKIQLIMLNVFVEWQDGLGQRTGKVLTKRDLDTPLLTEDEFLFEIHDQVDPCALALARDLVVALPLQLLSEDAREFLLRKVATNS